jgi:CHASE3 domain sensor protein
MLEPQDLDSIDKLIAQPMQKAMEAQKELLNTKLQSIGRSVDSIREDQTAQVKHCQKMTREMTDFKTGTTLKVDALEKDSAKKDKKTWAIILAVFTLGLSIVVKWVFKL